jgi:hypothetical protein
MCEFSDLLRGFEQTCVCVWNVVRRAERISSLVAKWLRVVVVWVGEWISERVPRRVRRR